MKLFTLGEYREWRKQMLAEPAGDTIETPRGSCIRLEPFIIYGKSNADFGIHANHIVDAEYALIFRNKIIDQAVIDKLYENDDALLAAYRKLDLERRFNEKRRFSRKNIVCVPECCLSYWQLHDQHLTVVSRSLDIQRAGLSDIAVVKRVALAMCASTFTFHAVCPHIYNDRTKIARRTK